MPKPLFNNTRSANIDVLREGVRDLSKQLGSSAGSVDLGVFDIDIVETKIPHGQTYTPTGWRIYNRQHGVRQTQASDRKFLYLIADLPLSCGIEVW